MDNNSISFELTMLENDMLTAQVRVAENPPFYLHSSVEPKDEAHEWLKRVEIMSDTIYIVLGAGLGYHIRALIEHIPDNSCVLVLHTPAETALLKVAGMMPDNNWLRDKRLVFMQIIDIHDMGIIIGDIMLKRMVKKIHMCYHYPAMRLALQAYQDIMDTLIPAIENSMAINFNVTITTNYVFFRNFWKNFTSIVMCPGIASLKGIFNSTPVLVVASGPSLDKNIEILKKCAVKVPIIAAGTAVGALSKHGITPNFIIATDAFELMYDAIKEFFNKETILLASTTVQHQVVSNYPGPKYFFKTSSDLFGSLTPYFSDVGAIGQNVSVATAAVDFARYCGARTIVLVGQDLSFPEGQNKWHADGVQAGAFDGVALVKVPGYYGGEVETVNYFKAVIEYYNQYAKEFNNIKFINATEGGALIKEMQNMSLVDVLKKLLPQENFFLSKLQKRIQAKADPKKRAGIVEELYRIRDDWEVLYKFVEEFQQKITDVSGQQTSNEQPLTPVQVEVFEDFYNELTCKQGYCLIEKIFITRIGLLKFQIQDGMSLELQYLFYVNMTAGLKEILYNFNIWLNESIERLTNTK